MFHHPGCNGIQIGISFEKQLLIPPVDSALYFYIFHTIYSTGRNALCGRVVESVTLGGEGGLTYLHSRSKCPLLPLGTTLAVINC